MFQIQDVVVYGSLGVCDIIGIEAKKVDDAVKNYFVLKPKNNPEATCYVPTWNEKALGKMRKVMSREEVNALIDSIPDQMPVWLENRNERKEAFRQILSSGDHTAIIAMLRALFIQKTERESEGKRLHMTDEQFIKDAEQILYNEWQYVLNVDKAGLMDYIFSRIARRN